MSKEMLIHDRSPTPLKVWVAGASGFCGRGITHFLAADPRFEVLPHIRPSSSRRSRLEQEWLREGLTPVICDWDAVEAMLITHQPHVIIGCLGTTKKHAKQGGGSYEEVDYGLTIKLMEAATQLNNAPHFVYISSMGADWGKWSTYLNARLRVEQALEDSSLSYSIIRPAILAGESRDEHRAGEAFGEWLSHAFANLFRRLKLRHLSYRVQPLDAPEMATFVGLILEHFDRSRDQEKVSIRHTYTVDMIHRALETRTLSLS